jgi:hypothetical protein
MSNVRKAIIIISDGEDNFSRCSVADFKEAVRESDMLTAEGLAQTASIATRNREKVFGGSFLQREPLVHFNSLVLNFPPGGLFLGSNFYNNTELNEILQNNAVGGNGLISLAHQLITAELNAFYGATPPQNVALAILDANKLIDSLVIPPIGTGFLSPSLTSADENILDAQFNSAGPDCPGPFANFN